MISSCSQLGSWDQIQNQISINTLRAISINDVITNPESNTISTFTVTLSKTSSEIITVYYVTEDVTAIAGSDYTGIETTALTFNPGELTKTIAVSILGDAIDEIDESYLGSFTDITLRYFAGTATFNGIIYFDNIILSKTDYLKVVGG